MIRNDCWGLLQEQDKLVMEMRSSATRKRERMAAIQQELAEAAAKLAASNPRQAERLQAEVGKLRETVGALSAYKVGPATAECFPACDFYLDVSARNASRGYLL